VGVEENTSKVWVAGDANLAAATLMTVGGTGTSLFVINLCASQAPAPNVAKTLPGLETYRLYQVARREDGRTRYRLRLGFFTSEAQAEAVLSSVRDAYPTAFTACLCDEDQKFARGFVPESSAAVAATPKMSVVENKLIPKPAPAKTAAPSAAPPIAKAPAVTTTAPSSKASAPAKAAAAPAKPAVTAKPPTAPAPRVNASSTGMFKLTQEPAAKPTVAQPAAVKGTTPPAAADEIELSWEAPTGAKPAIKAPAPASIPAAATKAPATKPVVTPTPPAPKQTIEAPSKLLASIELTLESEPAAAPKAAPVGASSEPFRVGKGVEIPVSSLTLQTESAPVAAASPAATTAPASKSAAPTPPSAPVTPAKSMAEASKMKAAQATAPSSIKASVAPPVRKSDGPAPDLDSTQTIRALTSDELKDESQEKWFAIQLAISDQPVNLEAMPRLDIFEAYRVYSVASAGSGKITHSLRIGFFREEVSAEAVSGYLKTFFASPSVVRISIAEQARFKDPPVAKPAAKEAKVLDLSHARDRSPKVIPTITMEVESPKFDPNATGSFKANATGAHKALSATGTYKALDSTGAYKALKSASKSAPPATKRSEPLATGRHKALQPKRSLSQQLMDEAREVELSASGIRKLPKSDSLLSKMFGKKK
jgi:SPOR domain